MLDVDRPPRPRDKRTGGRPPYTNEDANGLIRQYLLKGTSMAHVAQEDCDAEAAKLNSRPRKRRGHKTTEECYARS
jgi:IS30 family transposase